MRIVIQLLITICIMEADRLLKALYVVGPTAPFVLLLERIVLEVNSYLLILYINLAIMETTFISCLDGLGQVLTQSFWTMFE